MPRKGKLEGAQPSASANPAATNQYDRWRSRVQELLVIGWQSSEDVEGIAATVVGMFDAGATDAEVATFLRSQEQVGEPGSLTEEARMTLVRELHRSAASAAPIRPLSEEL